MRSAHGYAIVDNDSGLCRGGRGADVNLELVEAAVRMSLRGDETWWRPTGSKVSVKEDCAGVRGVMVARVETAAGVKAFSVGKQVRS